MILMGTNTAAATFSDDWDSEEPTVLERFDRLPGSTLPPARTGTWAAISDEELRRVFTLGDDITSTLRDLPAVRL